MGKIIRKKIIKFILIGIPLALGVWFFLLRPKQLTSMVRRVEVENKVVNRTVSAKGSVKADNQADMTFISSGKIAYISVEKGDVVKKGQPLTYLDTSVQNQTVQSYKDARDVALRNKDLFEEQKDANITALGGEDEYDIKLRQLDEYISQAEAAYQAQVSLLKNSYIYAPFDGTVVSVNKKVGETAVTGETIITLADLNAFVFEISIDQEDYGYIKMDQPVRIKLDSYEGYEFITKVSELPLTADAVTGMFDIEIPIEGDNEHNITVGMLGDSYIDVLSTEDGVRALTIDEIYYDISDEPFVWIVVDGKLKKLPVELGVEGDIYTEIMTEVGEVFVPAVDGQKLTEGYTARIIN